MQNKNILVAGGTGVIGNYLMKKLSKNFRVKTFGSGEYDLRNKSSINLLLKKSKKFDVLIYLIGLAHKKRMKYDTYREVNFLCLKNLLETMEGENLVPSMIIFASTVSVYGEKLGIDHYNEKMKLNACSNYGKTKIEAENLLFNKYNDKSWLLRFAPVYSKDFTLNIDRRVKIKNNFFKIGDGLKQLSLCNIQNIHHVISHILNDKVPAGKYNVADKNPYTYCDLLENNNATKIYRIPVFFLRISYLIGVILKNAFLKENSIKLISSNTYSTKKINKYLNLPFSINDKN